MKKIKAIVAVLVIVVLSMGSYTKVKADGDTTGTERHAKELVEHDASDMLESSAWNSFDPSGKASYSEVAQWFYNVVVGPESYPSKKKAIAWVKKVYYAVALKNPEHATTLLEWFTDGKYAKFSSKKQVSWNWILRTAYVVCYYRGTPITVKNPFEGDASKLELYLFGEDYSIARVTHERWLRSYAKKGAKKPIRVEALYMTYELSREWDGFVGFD